MDGILLKVNNRTSKRDISRLSTKMKGKSSDALFSLLLNHQLYVMCPDHHQLGSLIWRTTANALKYYLKSTSLLLRQLIIDYPNIFRRNVTEISKTIPRSNHSSGYATTEKKHDQRTMKTKYQRPNSFSRYQKTLSRTS